MFWILKCLPKNHLSWLVGRLVRLPLPRLINAWAIRLFARLYSIDLEAASKDVEQYRSVGEFFVRELKAGLRPIPASTEGLLLSPADARLRDCGSIKDGRIAQIKDKTYQIAELLGDSELAAKFEGGTFFNLYLSPRDYHHVHSPVSGSIIRRIYIPGRLWPVNDWSLSRIENLFSVNERVVTLIRTAAGDVAVVMVGATNVGKIELSYERLITNQPPWGRRSPAEARWEGGLPIAAGAELGVFHMGSSVVVLCSSSCGVELRGAALQAPGQVQYGQCLGLMQGVGST